MPNWLTPALIVAVFCGGLGGAVFTWWVTRDVPVSLHYAVTTTTTGADPAVQSLVPDLTIRIKDEPVAAIHTHAVEIVVAEGFAESVPLAITFQQKPVFYGRSTSSASPLQPISCEDIDHGLKCVLGSAEPPGRYQIAMSTDIATAPQVLTSGPRVRLVSITDIASGWRKRYSLFEVFAASLMVGLAMSTISAILLRIRSNLWRR